MRYQKINPFRLLKFEFIRYTLVGGIATIMDWSIFYIFAIILGIYYQIALVISFVIVGITHYTLSKIFTFKCKSKKIIKQFSLFMPDLSFPRSVSILNP